MLKITLGQTSIFLAIAGFILLVGAPTLATTIKPQFSANSEFQFTCTKSSVSPAGDRDFIACNWHLDDAVKNVKALKLAIEDQVMLEFPIKSETGRAGQVNVEITKSIVKGFSAIVKFAAGDQVSDAVAVTPGLNLFINFGIYDPTNLLIKYYGPYEINLKDTFRASSPTTTSPAGGSPGLPPSVSTSAPVDSSFQITLTPGWNMIGVRSVTTLEKLKRTNAPCSFKGDIAFTWNGQQYIKATSLRPTIAYWVSVPAPCVIDLGAETDVAPGIPDPPTFGFNFMGGAGGTAVVVPSGVYAPYTGISGTGQGLRKTVRPKAETDKSVVPDSPQITIHKGYNMISYPALATLTDFEGCDFTNAKLWHWESGAYKEYYSFWMGHGYWLKSEKNCVAHYQKDGNILPPPPQPKPDQQACVSKWYCGDPIDLKDSTPTCTLVNSPIACTLVVRPTLPQDICKQYVNCKTATTGQACGAVVDPKYSQCIDCFSSCASIGAPPPIDIYCANSCREKFGVRPTLKYQLFQPKLKSNSTFSSTTILDFAYVLSGDRLPKRIGLNGTYLEVLGARIGKTQPSQVVVQLTVKLNGKDETVSFYHYNKRGVLIKQGGNACDGGDDYGCSGIQSAKVREWTIEPSADEKARGVSKIYYELTIILEGVDYDYQADVWNYARVSLAQYREEQSPVSAGAIVCTGLADTSCPTGYKCIQDCGAPVTNTNSNQTPTFTCQPNSYVPNCPICLALNTLIDSPAGQIPVQKIQNGMTVWTTNKAGKRVVGVVTKVGKVAVTSAHQMIELILADDRKLLVSPGHPTADGRLVENLAVGEIYNGAKIVSTKNTPYEGGATYDILPSGETGFYWANGILIGSTLR